MRCNRKLGPGFRRGDVAGEDWGLWMTALWVTMETVR